MFGQIGYMVGAEIGVYKGKFSARILDEPSIGLLYSVDSWKDVDGGELTSIMAECRERLSKYGNRSRILAMDSVEAAATIGDGTLDFVYIDADHRYEMVRRDMFAWWPKIRMGGIMAGHDYSPGKAIGKFQTTAAHPETYTRDVIKAVNRFVKVRRLSLHLTREKGPSWWFFKR